jgi:Putative multicopper oxidases
MLCFGAFAICETSSGGQTRTYFIAADEVVWDYAPSDLNQITGKDFDAIASLFVKKGPQTLGHIYKKAIYREYTDATFTTLKTRPPELEYLGFLGPVLRAEVGDTINIRFKNNTTHTVSMHPHGVFYTKSSEGAPYADGTKDADKADDGVAPGKTYTYVWLVPERAGPVHGESSSALWMYHSHVQETGDVNAGLIGPLIITGRGEAKPDGSPKDVDREIIVLFSEMDENTSLYYDENVKTYAQDPANIPKNVTFADPYYLSNLKEAINGYLFGNGPIMRMRKGEHVRWYILGSTNFEMHAPHWHGNTVVSMHMRTDVLSLMPMGMMIADMIPDDVGIWLFHCHVAPHLDAGMIARYEVDQ